MLHDRWKKGFSLVELLVVVGMMAILLSIGGLSLSYVRTGSHVDLVASEIRSEIMRSQAETSNGHPSGVYFETNRYVYFEGTTYTEGAITNEENILPASLTLSDISLPSNTILFNNTTGNPLNFTSPFQVTLSGDGDRVISVNEWGVVEVN
jgi:prepilin-type N-terminal cleavage/methylation domain-containing protein